MESSSCGLRAVYRQHQNDRMFKPSAVMHKSRKKCWRGEAHKDSDLGARALERSPNWTEIFLMWKQTINRSCLSS